jgi:SAM-dependent methyltransferase
VAAIERAASELGLDAHSVVLDLGAGTGNLTHTLRDHFARVVAVEPDAAMRAQFDGEVLAGSAEQIPLPDASVDAVFAGEAFHWFDYGPALEEIRRVGSGLAALARSWGETEQPGLLPAPFWAELETVWACFHHDGRDTQFRDWQAFVQFDASETFVETRRIGGRDLVDLHLTASTPASIDDEEREAIAARAYPLMEDEYDLRVVTYLYWKRL